MHDDEDVQNDVHYVGDDDDDYDNDGYEADNVDDDFFYYNGQ